jgi:hypothetical protein
MQPSTLPNRVRGIGPSAAGSVLQLAFDLRQAANDLFGHADDSAFIQVILRFSLLSVLKALAADAGTLHRPGQASSRPSVSWLRDFFDYDLWPTWFS